MIFTRKFWLCGIKVDVSGILGSARWYSLVNCWKVGNNWLTWEKVVLRKIVKSSQLIWITHSYWVLHFLWYFVKLTLASILNNIYRVSDLTSNHVTSRLGANPDYSLQVHIYQWWKVQSHSQGEVRRLHASNITNTGISC